MDKKLFVETFYKKHNIPIYINDWDNDVIDVIASVIMGDKINDLNELSASCNNHLGSYYWSFNNDIEKASECYQIAIQKGSKLAILNMGNLCGSIQHYADMVKYYTIAADKYHNVQSMYLLGFYYHSQGNYNYMLKYALRAAEFQHRNAIYLFGFYYRNIKQYDQMIFYFEKASRLGSISSMYYMGVYYGCQNNYGKMIKYFAKAIAHGCPHSLKLLVVFYLYKKQNDHVDKYLLIGLRAGISPEIILNDIIGKYQYNPFLDKIANENKLELIGFDSIKNNPINL